LAKRAGIWPAGAVSDPDFASVSLLLHMDGTNGSTTFTDSSSNAVSITANADAQITTSTFKFGTGSSTYDGTGDYLNTPSSSLFNFGAGSAFTVECFIKFASLATRNIYSQRIVGVYAAFEISQSSSGYSWLIGNASIDDWATNATSSTGLISIDTWYHTALVGDGTNVKFYHDGTEVLTASQPAWTSGNRTMYIGGGGDNRHEGQIDEFRVTKGVARYTSAFTRPTAPFPNS
jgi:hypothetical protein